jgi:hypothetical protein
MHVDGQTLANGTKLGQIYNLRSEEVCIQCKSLQLNLKLRIILGSISSFSF